MALGEMDSHLLGLSMDRVSMAKSYGSVRRPDTDELSFYAHSISRDPFHQRVFRCCGLFVRYHLN